MENLEPNELVRLEIELAENKLIRKQQLKSLFCIFLVTIIFHFMLIYFNNSLKMETTFDSILNFFTMGYGLLASTVLFFFMVTLFVRRFAQQHYDILLINNISSHIRDAKTKKRNIINYSILDNGLSYKLMLGKRSLIERLTEKVPFIVYLIFLSILVITFSIFENFYNKIISYIPMNYSINKFVQTDEFIDLYHLPSQIDIEGLKNIDKLPDYFSGKKLSSDSEILDSTIQTLNTTNDFLDMNISYKSEVLEAENYSYYLDLAEELSKIAIKLEVAWAYNDINLYKETVKQLEIIIKQAEEV